MFGSRGESLTSQGQTNKHHDESSQHNSNPGPQVIKLLFMLNSAELKILNAYKY